MLSKWMSQLSDEHRSKPINQLCLPGAHDSAAYQVLDVDLQKQGLTYWTGKFDCLPVVKKVIRNWTLTQSRSPAQQFIAGIREFDFRLSVKQGSDQFYFSHSYACAAALPCLAELKNVVLDSPGEFLLINITKDFRNQRFLSDAACRNFLKQAVDLLEPLLLKNKDNRLDDSLTLKSIEGKRRILLNFPYAGFSNKFVWRLSYRQLGDWTPDLASKTKLIQEFAEKLITNPPDRQQQITCLTLTLTPSDALVKQAITRLDLNSGVFKLHFENRAALQRVYEQLDKRALLSLTVLETDFADEAMVTWILSLVYS